MDVFNKQIYFAVILLRIFLKIKINKLLTQYFFILSDYYCKNQNLKNLILEKKLYKVIYEE
jgi:hypothetical protein